MTFDPKTELQPGDRVLIGPSPDGLVQASYWMTVVGIDGKGAVTVVDESFGDETTWTAEDWASSRVPRIVDFRRGSSAPPSVQSDVQDSSDAPWPASPDAEDEPFAAPPAGAVVTEAERARGPASIEQKDCQGAGSLAHAVERLRKALLQQDAAADAFDSAQCRLQASQEAMRDARSGLEDMLRGVSEPFSGGVAPALFQTSTVARGEESRPASTAGKADEIPFGKPAAVAAEPPSPPAPEEPPAGEETPPQDEPDEPPVEPPPAPAPDGPSVSAAERKAAYEAAKPGFVNMPLRDVPGITAAKSASMAVGNINTVSDWIDAKDASTMPNAPHWAAPLRNFGPASVAQVEGAMSKLIDGWQEQWKDVIGE